MDKKIIEDFILEYGSDWARHNINGKLERTDWILINSIMRNNPEEHKAYNEKTMSTNMLPPDEYNQLMAEYKCKYLTYFIGAGLIEELKEEVNEYGYKRVYYIVKKEIHDEAEKIKQDEKNKKEYEARVQRNNEIKSTLNDLGLEQKTGIIGIKAKYINPKCYTEDPGIPPDSATEGVRNLIVTPIILIFRYGIALVIVLWALWVYHLIQNRNRVRDDWEREYGNKK